MRFNAQPLAVLLCCFCTRSEAHNWINMPARVYRVSPGACPKRLNLQQAHVQVNQGDTIPVEWASGHSGTEGNWVLVHAKDEGHVRSWNYGVAKSYFDGAKSVEKFKVYHVTEKKKADSYLPIKHSKDGFCGKAGSKLFTKTVERKDLGAYDRPTVFPHNSRRSQSASDYGFLEYNPASPCSVSTWTSYQNDQYPWVQAASKYKVVWNAAANGALSLFKVPDNIPPGKYVLFWYWRGYNNCIDMDIVVRSNKIDDKWGTPPSSAARIVTRVDHCQTQRRSVSTADPSTAIPARNQLPDARAKYESENQRVASDYKTANEQGTFRQQMRNAVKQIKTKEYKVANEKNERRQKGYQRGLDGWKKILQENTDLNNKALNADKVMAAAKKAYEVVFDKAYGNLNRQDWGLSDTRCKVVPAGGDAAAICGALCEVNYLGSKQCDSVNIMDAQLPATSAFAGQLNSMIPDQCKDMTIGTGAKICYALKEGPETDGGDAVDVTTDPEDPVFYSTCIKYQQNLQPVFSGNTCGDACFLGEKEADFPTWRYGDKCVSCDLMHKNDNSDIKFVPEWTLASTCENCDGSTAQPTQTPTTATPTTAPCGKDSWGETCEDGCLMPCSKGKQRCCFKIYTEALCNSKGIERYGNPGIYHCTDGPAAKESAPAPTPPPTPPPTKAISPTSSCGKDSWGKTCEDGCLLSCSKGKKKCCKKKLNKDKCIRKKGSYRCTELAETWGEI